MTQHLAAPSTGTSDDAPGHRTGWWQDAVIYQVYPRSFADGNGDGMGDLAGVTARLPYLRDLGVDAVWLSPFYASPQADAGYDVADYRAIDPMFGTLLDADALIREAHGLSLRVIVDLVPNHSSDQHEWFKRALAEGPGSALRERYHFRPGKGTDGELPPNDWESIFGGPAWTRTTDPDGTPGDWYLHLFAPEQPDFNWEHPAVADEFRSILRFWLDMGADGFRVDVAHGLVKAEGLPDLGSHDQLKLLGNDVMPFFDQDGVHEIYRSWRTVLDEYSGDRVLVAEAWTPTVERTANYVRPDEMHQAFNFQYLSTAWDAAELRTVIDSSLDAMRPVGAPTTWVLSNHDVTRHATRFGNPPGLGTQIRTPGDRELGLRRARAATLLMLALPGSAYIYQGEELGLPDVTDLPDEARQTRPSSGPRARTATATAAASRSRGPARAARTASAAAAAGCRSPTAGASSPSRRSPARRAPRWSCTAPRSPHGVSTRVSAPVRTSSGWTPPRACSPWAAPASSPPSTPPERR